MSDIRLHYEYVLYFSATPALAENKFYAQQDYDRVTI